MVLGERLEALLEWMRGQQADAFDAEIFVDKHHVQERVYGQHAAFGWIGKNTCLINREQGSHFFLPASRPILRSSMTRPASINAQRARSASTPARPVPSSMLAS